MNSKKSRHAFLAVLALLAAPWWGCAEKKPLPQPIASNNYTDIREIGISFQTIQGALTVRSVVPYLPAMVAGIRSKDVVLKVDGGPRTYREAVEILLAKKPGERTQFLVQRKNDVLKFDVEPMEKATAPTTVAMRRIMSEERPVKLAIITGRISSTVPTTPSSWEDIMRTMLQGSYEDRFREQFSEDQGLTLIDRIVLGPLVLQYRINATGELPEAGRKWIGTVTRATHILLVNNTRVPVGTQCLDRTEVSLFEVESGKVLAADIVETPACQGGAGMP